MNSTGAKRRWTRGLGVTGAAFALGFASLAGATGAAAATPGPASWYAAAVGSSGVNVRDCYHPVQLPPSTSCTYQTALSAGTGVHVVCQRSGQNIGGDAVWDYVTYPGGEGFVADYYINTGYSSWIPGIDICQ
ncbi:hypothetical protein [Streptomyces sp. NPDC058394]|uniref:hypothetical protein n=1 Tax=Streptomyces sp. NPDC058394 TaxID=3346477 RepID=UPI00365F79DB